jgi:hypothetical protein
MVEEFRGMGYLDLQIGNVIIYGGSYNTRTEAGKTIPIMISLAPPLSQYAGFNMA